MRGAPCSLRGAPAGARRETQVGAWDLNAGEPGREGGAWAGPGAHRPGGSGPPGPSHAGPVADLNKILET